MVGRRGGGVLPVRDGLSNNFEFWSLVLSLELLVETTFYV